MTNQNNAAQTSIQPTVLTREQVGELYKDWICIFGMSPGSAELCIREIEAAVLSKLRAPVADEPCKRCGGPGWYTNHTTGYPESFPCTACNPQGVSVERLAKDPFLAAQLWRKPAQADGSLLERILEHVGEYGESMASSALLSVRSIARRNVETRIAAELAALASAPVAGEAIAGYMVGSDYFRPDVLAAARVYAENRNLTVRALRYADAAPQASEAVNAAMADEYRRWIDYYHQGRDYDSFLKECVHKPAALSAQPGAQKKEGA